MNQRAKVGAVMVAVGLAIWFFAPFQATFGEQHYVRHVIGYAVMGLGAVFLLAGARGP
ncbi:MAG TPA: hypothetical protein VN874_02415 [Myxococcales bacterium]|nr:hypothetical protein [Myxococcales bacterium]